MFSLGKSKRLIEEIEAYKRCLSEWQNTVQKHSSTGQQPVNRGFVLSAPNKYDLADLARLRLELELELADLEDINGAEEA